MFLTCWFCAAGNLVGKVCPRVPPGMRARLMDLRTRSHHNLYGRQNGRRPFPTAKVTVNAVEKSLLGVGFAFLADDLEKAEASND